MILRHRITNKIAGATAIIMTALLLMHPSVGAIAATTLDPQTVDTTATNYMNTTKLPGMAVAVVNKDGTTYSKGYGTSPSGAITADTKLPIASASKSFTGAAALQLVDDGKLDLDKKVVDYIPSFKMADDRYKQITIRQLLNHTSGMSDRTFPEKSAEQPADLAGAVKRLETVRLSTNPGEKYSYHNPNYQVAARIVEVVSGQSFSDYLRDNIFQPLGMKNTTIVDLTSEIPAQGYIQAYGLQIPAKEPQWFANGSGQLVTTANDFSKWLYAMLNGGVGQNATRILSSDGIKALQNVPENGRYALGFRNSDAHGTKQIFHEGWLFTFSSEQIIMPEKDKAVFVVANRGLGMGPVDGETAAQSIAGAVTGKPATTNTPINFIVDMVLLVLTLLTIVLGILGIRRAAKWAEKRHASKHTWTAYLRMLPLLIGPVLIFTYPALLKLAFSGRDANWQQVIYASVPLFIFFVVLSVVSLVVLVTRSIQLYRHK